MWDNDHDDNKEMKVIESYNTRKIKALFAHFLEHATPGDALALQLFWL